MIVLVDFSKKEDKERLYGVLKGLKPTMYKVELKVYRDTRSNRQNAYYWGVVLKTLSEYTGFTPGQMHEHLKRKFLTYQKPLPTGEMAEICLNTSDLDTWEFEQYTESIRRWAALDLDVQIPLPNEYLEV